MWVCHLAVAHSRHGVKLVRSGTWLTAVDPVVLEGLAAVAERGICSEPVTSLVAVHVNLGVRVVAYASPATVDPRAQLCNVRVICERSARRPQGCGGPSRCQCNQSGRWRCSSWPWHQRKRYRHSCERSSLPLPTRFRAQPRCRSRKSLLASSLHVLLVELVSAERSFFSCRVASRWCSHFVPGLLPPSGRLPPLPSPHLNKTSDDRSYREYCYNHRQHWGKPYRQCAEHDRKDEIGAGKYKPPCTEYKDASSAACSQHESTD